MQKLGTHSLPERLVGMLSDPEDYQLRMELYNYFYTQIALGCLALLYADPEHPDFLPMFNQFFNQVFPNPDYIYYVTPIDDDGIYKISGFRGTVRIVDCHINTGSMVSYGTGEFEPSLANYDLDTLNIDNDGSFEVILSPERPADYDGDWWELERTASFIIIRQMAYDWLNEEDARMAIERLDRPVSRPPRSGAEIEAALSNIPMWAENWTKTCLTWVQQIQDSAPLNKMEIKDFSASMADQRWAEGHFHLDDDEALIIEIELPERHRYWGFQLTDEFCRTIPWMDRQTSLNGHQARLDADGKFRAVISAKDPGVPNWLDTAGYKKGLMYMRYKECSSPHGPKVRQSRVDKRRPASSC